MHFRSSDFAYLWVVCQKWTWFAV